MAEWVAEADVILRAATLDDDPGVRPILHMWVSHDVPWLVAAEGVVRYPQGGPEP
jgi:hypothetical protein